MRRGMVAISVLACVSSVHASKRSINDLMYLPKANTFYVSAELNSTSTDVEVENSSDQDVYESELQKFSQKAEVGYSLTDRLGLGLVIPYTSSSEDTTKYGPASTKDGQTEVTKSSGLNDISVKGRFRFTRDDHKLRFDVFGEYSPKTGDSEAASTTKDGNEFRGGDSLTVGVEAGRKTERLQLRGAILYTFNGESETKQLSDNSISKTESTSSIEFLGEVQTHFTKKFYANAKASLAIMSDFVVENDGSKTTYMNNTGFSFGVGAGILITEKMALDLSVDLKSMDSQISSGLLLLDYEVTSATIAAGIKAEF